MAAAVEQRKGTNMPGMHLRKRAGVNVGISPLHVIAVDLAGSAGFAALEISDLMP